MSRYEAMWAKIHTMTMEQRRSWLKTCSPPKGRSVDLGEVIVNDVDFVEALKYMIEDDPRK